MHGEYPPLEELGKKEKLPPLKTYFRKDLKSWRSWVWYLLHGASWVIGYVHWSLEKVSDGIWTVIPKLHRAKGYVLTAKNYGEVPEAAIPNTEANVVETKRWRWRRK